MSPVALVRRIARLPKLPIAQLRDLWQQTFNRPPVVANRRFLERRLAYHWQATEYEAEHPGELARQRQRIDALAATFAHARDVGAQARYAPLPPGTVLVRVFKDVQHEVRVVGPTVFEYQGGSYRSLSEVARFITGTRWSGPAFFGLKPRDSGNRP